MTVSSSNTYEFTIQRLVYTAYRYAVLITVGQELTTEQLREGAEAFERLMRTLDMEGQSLRQTRYDLLELTADDRYVELPADVIEVGHSAMYIPASEADPENPTTETIVQRVFRDEIHETPGKSDSSQPSVFRLDKSTVPYRLEFWPMPDEAGYLRVESHKLAAESLDGAATPDRERHFFECLVNGVSWILAKSNGVSLERVMMLKRDFEENKLLALGQEKDVVDRCFKIGHRSGFRS